MKDFITFLAILMCIIGGGMWEINYLEETSRYLKTDLNYIEYYINLEKFDVVENELKRVKNTWNNMEKIWALFVHHDDIEYVNLCLAELDSNLEYELADEASNSISRLICNMDYTIECEKLKLQNIF